MNRTEMHCWATSFKFGDYFALDYLFIKQLKEKPRSYTNRRICQEISKHNLMLNSQREFRRNNMDGSVIEVSIRHTTTRHNSLTKRHICRKLSILVNPNKWFCLNKCPVHIPGEILLMMEIGYRFLFIFLKVVRYFFPKSSRYGFSPIRWSNHTPGNFAKHWLVKGR